MENKLTILFNRYQTLFSGYCCRIEDNASILSFICIIVKKNFIRSKTAYSYINKSVQIDGMVSNMQIINLHSNKVKNIKYVLVNWRTAIESRAYHQLFACLRQICSVKLIKFNNQCLYLFEFCVYPTS